LLLAAGAVVDLKDKAGRMALVSASDLRYAGAVRVLRQAGAQFDAKDIGDWTTLKHVFETGNTRAVRVPLAKTLNLKDDTGDTPLVVVIRSGNLEAACLLLETGAEPSLVCDCPDSTADEMQQLLTLHRAERLAWWAEAGRTAAEVAAEAAADALLAEEEAEKASAESRQAKARRKKQRQKTKRAEAATGVALSGADPPSQAATAVVAAGVGDDEEGHRAATEQDSPEGVKGDASSAERRALQATDGADDGGEEKEERETTLDAPPPVASRERPRRGGAPRA